MRDAHTDRRPRILDFSTSVDGVGVRRNLAWPCHAFRVTVPIRSGGGLNVFEDTILKLLDNARRDVETLADITCLDVDLVTLVCYRLRDLEMLTQHNEISELGQAYLSKVKAATLDYQVRFVFREMIGGKLLPVVYGGELKFEELVEWNGTGAKIRRTSRKGEAETGGPFLRIIGGRELDRRPNVPTAREVLWAMERHRSLSRHYLMLRHGVEPCPSAGHLADLDIDSTPERVFLRCRAVVPVRSTDFRIADPFGYGFSETIERAYREVVSRDKAEEDFILGMKELAVAVRPSPPKARSQESADAAKAVLHRLAESVTDHLDMFKKLRTAEMDFERCRRRPRSSDEEAHFAYHGQRVAQSLSEALEQALCHIVSESGTTASEAILSNQTLDENEALLKQLAAKIGLHTEGLGSFLRVLGGRIKRLRDGAVDLQALLALTVAGAVGDPSHPLQRIASETRDWLLFARNLKETRDSGAHGHSREAGLRKIAWLRDRTYESIEVLLPKLKKEIPSTEDTVARTNTGVDRDERLRARTALERSLGVQGFAILDSEVAELLIQVELAAFSFGQKDGEQVEVARHVTDLASVLQHLVHARLPAYGDDGIESTSIMTEAQRRAVEAGLLKHGDEWPRSLVTVAIRRIHGALHGHSPSLGACLVALLLVAPVEELRDLGVGFPGFVLLCARILDLREHGNKPVWMSPRGFLDLKREVLGACQALMEA